MYTFKGKTCTIHQNDVMPNDLVISINDDVYIEVDTSDILGFAIEFIKNNNINQVGEIKLNQLFGIVPEEVKPEETKAEEVKVEEVKSEKIKPITIVVEPINSEYLEPNGIFIGQNVYNKFYSNRPCIGEYVDIYRLPMYNELIIRLKIQGVQKDNISRISLKNIIAIGCEIDKDIVELIPVNPYDGFTGINGTEK